MDLEFLKAFPYGNAYNYNDCSVFATAEELINSNKEFAEGEFVRTECYYLKDDLGGARYVVGVEENAGSLTLKNGLYANIVADVYAQSGENFNIINVRQFGAEANGITSDQNAFNAAFTFAGSIDDGTNTVIYIPEGEYRMQNEILANDLKNVIVTGAGEQTVIYTDDDYKSYWEFFFACWRDEDCFFGNFKVEARESINFNKYFRQMTLIDCSNVYLYNLTLNVPQSAWAGEEFADKQYTNLTFYSGDKNITADSCTLYQMSGTYRGANICIADFYQRGTENITVKNCVLHDNARDEQVGIFSFSFYEDSYVKGVNFLNNKVYTHPTPYRDVVGTRTMCFTVAYANNNVSEVNIEGNQFECYADSKFMTFGSVRNCTVKNNTISIFANNGKTGYVFDSSCTNDGDVIIEGNDLYLTYAHSPVEGKCVSAGHLTFKNNYTVADCTVDKIADRLGVYEENEFIFLGSFGSCGSAVRFNNNNVTSYAEHSNEYNEIFFIHTGDSAFNENTVLEFVGNTVTDYTYFHGTKNQKVYDKLCTVNNVNIKELRITDNEYNCPNYSYQSPDDYMWICWVRSEAKIQNFICENNNLQGANIVYGAEGGHNTLREFNIETYEPNVTDIKILHEGEHKNEISASGNIMLTSQSDNECEILWFTGNKKIATAENGSITQKGKGAVTVFAATKDGSGTYAKIKIVYESDPSTSGGGLDFYTVALIIFACIALAAAIGFPIVAHIRNKRKNEETE